MGFLLKIYFVGLVSFLPHVDGEELTVFVLDARRGYAVSDGTWMEAHEPLLLTRAARCSGDCEPDFQAIADVLYQLDPEENRRQLASALAGGGAWRLDGSELFLGLPEEASRARPGLEIRRRSTGVQHEPTSPESPAAWEAFDWVAEIGRVDASAAMIDPDVLAEQPEKGLIVARMKLASGEIRTERLVTLDDDVVQLEFAPLREDAPPSEYAQPLADWVVAEIPVSGCDVTVSERRFDGLPGRRITVGPERCDGTEVVEAVLINLPHDSFGPRAMDHPREDVGKHFEMFYELAYLRPPNRMRPVPIPAQTSAEVEETLREIRRRRVEEPKLLGAIGLPNRGAHSRPICALSQFSGVATDTTSVAPKAE